MAIKNVFDQARRWATDIGLNFQQAGKNLTNPVVWDQNLSSLKTNVSGTRQNIQQNPLTQNKYGQAAINNFMNSGQAFLSGVEDVYKGTKNFNPAKVITGVGRMATPFTGLFQGANLVASFPYTIGTSPNLVTPSQQPLPNKDQVRRTARGVLQGMSGIDELGSNVQLNKSVSLPLVGEFDPYAAIGSAYGFTQNPVNKKLFKYTETLFPSSGKAAQWITNTAVRGGLQNLFFALSDIPENATNQEKTFFILKNIPEGIVQEFIGQGISKGLDLSISGVNKTGVPKVVEKQLSNLFDQLREAKRKLEIPVATTDINPKTGERIVKPMWQTLLGSESGFIKPDEFVPGKLKAGGGEYDLKNLNTTNEVTDLIKTQAKQNEDLIKTERRGKISFEETRAKADEITKQYGLDLALKRKTGKALNAEEIVAAGDLLKTTSEKANTLTKQYQQAVEAGQATPLMRAQTLEAMNQQAMVMNKVLGAETEAGRALNAIKILKQAVENPESSQLKKIINRFGGEEGVDNIIKKYNELAVDNPEAGYNYLRSLNKPNFADKLTEYWYNSILSSPATHVVNTTSNALAALLSPVERVYSAALDVPISKLQGRQRGRFFGEAVQDLVGARAGVVDGTRKALEILKKGYSMEDVAKMELRRPEAFTGKTGAVINIPSRALTAADAFFKSINQSAALHAEAYRMAKQQGFSGKGLTEQYAKLLSDPPPQLVNRAGDIAKYRLFQQEAGEFTKKVSALRSVKFKGVEPIRFIIPFIETPVNLLKFGLERTPAGVVSAIGKQGAEVSDQLGKALMGSTVAGALAFMAAEGKLTGRGPSNTKDRDRLYKAGWQPYSIKIGDKWVSYQRIEPFNQVFTQVALAFDEFADNKNAPMTDKIQGIGLTLGQNLVSQTYLSGLSDVLNAISDPERYGGNVLERFAGSLLPASSLTRFAARTQDPVVRDPEGLGEAIKANLPGLSTQVKPKENSFGEPIVREGGALRQASPYKFTTQKGDVGNLQQQTRLAQNIRDAKNDIKNGRQPKAVDQRTKDYLTAEHVYSQITNASKENKASVIKQLRDSGQITPEVEQRVQQISKAEKQNLTISDREIAILYDGEFKAQKILERLREYSNKENKLKKIQQYRQLGIITPEIEQEIIRLSKKTK